MVNGDPAGATENLTQYQNITDALLTIVGESLVVQQALLHIAAYEGKNLFLKLFIQDVENGEDICPDLRYLL